MKFTYFLLIFLFGVTCKVSAQDNVKSDEIYFKALIDSTRSAIADNDYKEAISLSSKLIEQGEEQNSNLARFFGYDVLGTVYDDLQDTLKTRTNTSKALEYALASKNDSLIAWANLNMGNVLADSKKTYDRAIFSFQQSLNFYKSNNDVENMYLAYINIADVYFSKNELENARSFIMQARALEKENEIFDEFIVYNDFLLGQFYYKTNQFNLSEKVLLKTVKAIERDSIFLLGEDSYGYLTKVYEKKKNYYKAFQSLKKEKTYGEANYEENKLHAIEVASAKFNLKEYKKDLKNALIEKEYAKKISNFYTIIIGFLSLAIVGIFLLFRTRKKYIDELSKKNKELTVSKNEAEKLSKVKSQFFSTVSHELRTPLYGVVGISSMLQEDENLSSYKEQLNSLKFSADYLLSLINDVLLLSKMDYQDLVLEKVPFQLSTLVNSIIESFKFSLEQNNNRLIVSIDENVPNNLIGSSVRISQILMNLIANAIKFNENGTIWLTIKKIGITDDGLCEINFIIKDDGIGIPKDKQKVIFEEFSQVENNNHSHKGTGLGLTIVKKLLKLHNSKIQLSSEIGKGSEFSFTLQLLKNEDDDIKLKDDNSSKELRTALIAESSNIHILVVDDNKINQKVTQGILSKNNIQSSVASDGEEAILLAKDKEYSLILMDINMPNIDGIEATKIIRKFNKEVPIIALTAVEVEEMRVKILEAGMNDILSKPYGASQFLSTILRNLNIKVET